jgi:hypothetical protein
VPVPRSPVGAAQRLSSGRAVGSDEPFRAGAVIADAPIRARTLQSRVECQVGDRIVPDRGHPVGTTLFRKWKAAPTSGHRVPRRAEGRG